MKIDARGKSVEESLGSLRQIFEGVAEGIVTVILEERDKAEQLDRLVRKEGYCTGGVEETEEGFRLDVVKGYSCSLQRG